MCGIVGILGREAVAGQLVDALKRLEYRGYDSAGIATVENGHLERRRAEGKLKNLESMLGREPFSGLAGIGHTRWATHGRRPRTTRIRMRPSGSRSCITASSRISANCATSLKKPARVSDRKPTPKWSRISSPSR